MIKSVQHKSARLYVLLTVLASLFSMEAALAHGERNQEPFLRMRTLHWYDVKFSVEEDSVINVNDEVTITGKFRIFSNWPQQVPEPERMYLNVNSNGATFVKLESWVNGKPAIQSMIGLVGRDYAFKIKLKARWEGTWHVHPMLNVKAAGGLGGPGIYITIKGDHRDFEMPATTLEGEEIENLSTYGLDKVFSWHIYWLILAFIWLGYWIAKPLLLPRWLMVKDGEHEDKLVTKKDTRVGLIMMIVVLVSVFGSVIYTEIRYPRVIPLQAGTADIAPLDLPPTIKVDMTDGQYYIPGRTVIAKTTVTNTSSMPVRLGEFTSANLRFLADDVIDREEVFASNYPKSLIAKSPLIISDNSPIQPGETRNITIEASDAGWETERLTSLMKDPESTLGALLFFYDDEGTRYISELFGGLLPVFKHQLVDQ